MQQINRWKNISCHITQQNDLLLDLFIVVKQVSLGYHLLYVIAAMNIPPTLSLPLTKK